MSVDKIIEIKAVRAPPVAPIWAKFTGLPFVNSQSLILYLILLKDLKLTIFVFLPQRTNQTESDNLSRM